MGWDNSKTAEGADGAKLKRDTIEAMKKIRGEGRKVGGELEKVSKKIYENCQSHMDELFVEVVNNEGEILDDFVEELQNVTDDELQEARQLIRKFPQHPLVKSDVKRPEILRDFVILVEDAYKDVHDADISMWLSNFIDPDARMTP